MGGGKTHSMIALGLLASHEKIREKVFPAANFTGKVRTAVISGRMKMKNCLWGEVAEQLGNLKLFAKLVSPPEAPSQEEWVDLLSGQPTLILFDELAPYFEGAAGKLSEEQRLRALRPWRSRTC